MKHHCLKSLENMFSCFIYNTTWRWKAFPLNSGKYTCHLNVSLGTLHFSWQPKGTNKEINYMAWHDSTFL